MDLVFS